MSHVNPANGLSNDEIKRYSRQLLIPEFGIESQLKLKSKKALIIGCGGLGCPSALYLSSSGIGTLGLLDHDHVEITNIHRQIAHDVNSIGSSKAMNLANRCKSLNDAVNYKVYECLFEKSNAVSIVYEYDVVLDCTDNVITRYLINDVCVLLNKPLVSGSALKFEGQMTVYNYLNGPCYRCLYPKAPPAETVSNCSDAGIMGPIVGMIGSMQALEAIKVLCNIGTTLNGRMLIFDGLDFQTRIIKLRPRQIDTCAMCKQAAPANKRLTHEEVSSIIELFDYNLFCGVQSYDDKTTTIKLLDDEKERVTCAFYKEISSQAYGSHLLIDVRSKTQFNICSLPNSIKTSKLKDIPFDEFLNDMQSVIEQVRDKLDKLDQVEKKSIYVVCRRGNDSQLAVDILNKHIGNESNVKCIKDVIGGLQAWTNTIDSSFPSY